MVKIGLVGDVYEEMFFFLKCLFVFVCFEGLDLKIRFNWVDLNICSFVGFIIGFLVNV